MVIILAAMVFLAVLVFKNAAPFGASVEYHIDFKEGVNRSLPKPLTPSTALGVETEGSLYELPEVKMTTDMATFELDVPYEHIDSAEVTIEYGGDPDELLFGMAAGNEPYSYKPVNNRSLNQLAWDRVEEDRQTLFQKSGDYETISEFLLEPPLPASGEQDYPRVAGYYSTVPQPDLGLDPSLINAGTTVDAALRGPHSLYVYVGSEPLRLSFSKKELNWEKGPDPLDVSVIAGTETVWATNVPDDGIEDGNRQSFMPQDVEFTVEGLQEGVYRIDLVCGYDVIIEGLESAQGYLSFVGQVYDADNELYGTGPTRPVTIYTEEREVTAWTWHEEAFQTLDANGELFLELNSTEARFPWGLPPGLNEIHGEKGGFGLMAVGGIFSFSRERYFDPFPLETTAYDEDLLLTDIEYILADYILPTQVGDWLTREISFDLEDVVISDNKLKCALSAPGLQKAGGEILLGSITIRLEK
jgi:hypothetical protein